MNKRGAGVCLVGSYVQNARQRDVPCLSGCVRESGGKLQGSQGFLKRHLVLRLRMSELCLDAGHVGEQLLAGKLAISSKSFMPMVTKALKYINKPGDGKGIEIRADANLR